MRQNIASNKAAPSSALANLVHDDDDETRTLVAKHPDSTPDVLTVLAADSSSDVRYQVALNPNAPVAALAQLTDRSEQWAHDGSLTDSQNPLRPIRLLSRRQKMWIVRWL